MPANLNRTIPNVSSAVLSVPITEFAWEVPTWPAGTTARRCSNEEVYITLRMRLPPQDRPEQGEPGHAQGADPPAHTQRAFDGLLSVENRRLHAYSLSRDGDWDPGNAPGSGV